MTAVTSAGSESKSWFEGEGRGGGQLIYFLGGYVCRMTQNCDP